MISRIIVGHKMSAQIFYLDKSKTCMHICILTNSHVDISASLINEKADSVICRTKCNTNKNSDKNIPTLQER